MKILIGCFGLILFTVVLLVVGAALNGYVLTRYWEWFVIPLFPRAPVIAWVPAIGLAIMARILMGNYHQTAPTSEEKKKENKKEELPNWALAAIALVWKTRNGRGKDSDLPPSIMAAIIALTRGEETPKQEEKTELSPWAEKICNATFITVLGPCFLLLVGWIVHSFI